MKRSTRDFNRALDEQVNEFERDNPDIAEAMRLFGMSMKSYASAVQAANLTKSTTSDSTSVRDAYAHLDGHS
jgi:hypothetical protein